MTSLCPLCYPYKKLIKPEKRPDYETSWGHHWYLRHHPDGTRDAVTLRHRGGESALDWDERRLLGFELERLLRTPDGTWIQSYDRVVYEINREHGHFVLRVLKIDNPDR